jgi:hypothetical protein
VVFGILFLQHKVDKYYKEGTDGCVHWEEIFKKKKVE